MNIPIEEYELTPRIQQHNDKEEEAGDDDYHNAILGLPPSNLRAFDRNISDDVSSPKLSVPKKKSGLIGASGNLVNSIVGAGIIGIPYAFRQSGLIFGLLSLLLVGYLTDYSLRMIVDLASFHPTLVGKDVRTFEDLAQVPFGKLGKNFILFNMFLMAYGAMVAYLLIIKDTVPTVLGIDRDAGWERELIMLATSVTIMVPLSLMRDMASLSVTSFFSVLADVVLVFFVTLFAPIARSVREQGGLGNILRNDAVEPTLFVGLGILSTAMACQHSAFIVGGSLKDKTRHRWSIVTMSSISFSTILCAVFGIAGYLGYLQKTQSDVLNNFEENANVARVLLAITMFFTYPMECFVARHVLVMLFYHGDMDGHDSSGEKSEMKSYRRYYITIIIYLMTLTPALIVDDIGPVLSITGSIAGGCISYMAPGFIYLGINSQAFISYTNSFFYTSSDVEAEDLPVEGDANATLQQTGDQKYKPLWWYLFGYPIWLSIAKYANIQQYSNDNSEEEEQSSPYQVHASPRNTRNSNSAQELENADVQSMVPTKKEYFVAIFFIVFGAISLVAGVGSNIYVIHTNQA